MDYMGLLKSQPWKREYKKFGKVKGKVKVRSEG